MFTSEPAAFDSDSMRILEDGTGVSFSDKGLSVCSLTDGGEAAEIELEECPDEVKSKLSDFDYGRNGIIADGNLLFMSPQGSGSSHELFCWEF